MSNHGKPDSTLCLALPAACNPGSETSGQIRWRAVLWLALLGPLFFISYGWANHWSARQAFVPTLWFAWERQIPFWDWSIVPYMSIDAFYALSLFIAASRAELDTHARRLLLATVFSVLGFWLFPLHFAFTRPEASGLFAPWFALLNGFDLPFNQAPSLHISLLILLWLHFARHWRISGWRRGWWRGWRPGLLLLHGWFALIGISVFTTWQHHVMDGVFGALVGVLCCYLLPQGDVAGRSDAQTNGAPTSDPRFNPLERARRWQLARRYLSAGALTCVPAYVWGGWCWLALWPGFALLLVGLAYAGLGVAVFQQQNGRMSWAARLLLAPYCLSAWLASRYFSRHDAVRVEVAPGVWIGRAPGRADWQQWQVVAVLDLCAEFNAGFSAGFSTNSPAGVISIKQPMLDLLAPTQTQLMQAVQALALLQQQAHGAPVLVHCALGYARSALVAAAWLLQRGYASSVPEALAHIKAVRPHSVFSANSVAMLQAFVPLPASSFDEAQDRVKQADFDQQREAA